MRAVGSKNAIMDLDRELTGIFREVVQFLECLREIKLPVTLENLRDNLLIRSKQTLTTFTNEKFGTRASPEPYLNMNPAAIRTKGFITPAIVKKGAELEEYVGAEEPGKQKQQQDYYESFQTVEANHAAAAATATATATATVAPNNNASSSSATASTSVSGMVASQQSQARDEKIEDPLIEFYASVSAAEAKSKCLKCGPLDRKEGRKLFVFEHYRTYWVGLVGSHLLVYENDRDSRPCMVLPIGGGYMARAAPNANPRDQRRNESTFEIFRPGSKTFQFVARTPKDMEQWVVKICEFSTVGTIELADSQKVPSAAASPEIDVPKVSAGSSLDLDDDRLDVAGKEERYQDVVGCLGVDKPDSQVDGKSVGIVVDERTTDSTLKNAHVDFANLPSCSMAAVPAAAATVSFPGPPLPARIPRRLPSLPVRGSSTATTSYVLQDEEEDDIYHKIEDFRNDTGAAGRARCYGNVTLATKSAKESSSRSDRKSRKMSESDAGRSIGERAEATYGNENEKEKEKEKEKENDTDVGNTSFPVLATTVDLDESYDDVESLLSRTGQKPSNERPTIAEKAGESSKSPQKKSFLDRVRSLKESPRKIERKTKGKAVVVTPPPPPPVDAQRLSTYDDVSGLISVQQTKRSVCSEEEEKKKKKKKKRDEEVEEESEYTCPPPPRPIYANPPTVADTAAIATATSEEEEEEELYDDVASCRRNYKEQDARQLDRVVESPAKSSQVRESSTRRKLDKSVPGDDIERPKSQEASFEESEHYQTPRPNSNHREQHPVVVVRQEELYDDIAILAEFTARQKELRNSRDSEETGEIRARASPEKRSWNRFVGSRKSKAADSVAAQQTNTARNSYGTDRVDDLVTTRMNTFQKLISKMENSLGKGPVKTTPTMLPNRTHVTDNA